MRNSPLLNLTKYYSTMQFHVCMYKYYLDIPKMFNIETDVWVPYTDFGKFGVVSE